VDVVHLPFLGDSSGELLAQFCGQTTPMIPLVVSTPELWVHFQTNQAIGDLGFKAKYLFSGELSPISHVQFLNASKLNIMWSKHH
jgi:hypothetical protein